MHKNPIYERKNYVTLIWVKRLLKNKIYKFLVIKDKISQIVDIF